MFAKFLEAVSRPAQKITEATGKQIGREFQREADRAAERIAKQVAKASSKRIVGMFATFGESDDEYYARTGTLREDDWG